MSLFDADGVQEQFFSVSSTMTLILFFCYFLSLMKPLQVYLHVSEIVLIDARGTIVRGTSTRRGTPNSRCIHRVDRHII